MSLAASYVNLANPGTNNAAPGTAPAWDSTNGWKGGSSAYLTTGIINSGVSWTWIVRFSNGPSSGVAYLFGSGFTYAFGILNDTGSVVRYREGNNNDVAPGISSGVLAIANGNCYRNGSPDGAVATPSVNAEEFYILARNKTAGAGDFSTAYIQAFAVYNVTLSDAQVAALTIAMNAL